MSIHWPIIKTCLRCPREVAFVDDWRAWRRVEILVASLHLAGEIERRCSSKTVGVLLPTGAMMPCVALAAWMLGRTIVPLNYLLKQDELQYVIDDCETDCIVTSRTMLEKLKLSPRAKSILHVEDMRFKGCPDLRIPAMPTPDDLALLLYTSGTSGKPKGVMLSHGNITTNICQAIDHVGFTRDDILLGVLPQFHSFGLTVLTLLPLTLGNLAVYTRAFIPQQIIRLMREHKPTAFIGLPSMYAALLRLKSAGPGDFRSLRFAISGGEPLPRAVAKDFRERFGVEINEGYGLTETSPFTNCHLPGQGHIGSVGRPAPGLLQRIVDAETDRVVEARCEGEIRFKGPNIMQGYFKLPRETAQAFDKDGFFRTGDIGKQDADGFLYITGRLKEMLIVGGENIFPREIEEVLNHHASVHESAVIGMADETRGERPVAFVEMIEGETFNEAALRAWCREHLAGYKVPTEIFRIDALPRNPTGKIMRRELKPMLDRQLAQAKA
ncbi:MAG: AMP-binding protein [Phycisphaerales bacterium]|nr:AMP-binding protein [Phycisphaerales bacterium]